MLRCNEALFHSFSPEIASMPQTTRRHLPSFDARSVMLFAALSMGGALAQAQQPASAPSTQIGPSAPAAKPTFGPGAPAAPASTTASAFERADTNRDGQLSAAEAAQLPAIGNRFKQLDKDHNGSLSRAEFEAGAKP